MTKPRHPSRHLARALLALATAELALGWAFAAGRGDVDPWSVSSCAFVVVGAVVAERRPKNAVGWVFCAEGVFAGYAGLVFAYAKSQAMVAVWLAWAVWVGSILILLNTTLIVLALLVFPQGELLSRRWRRAAWLGAVSGALLAGSEALTAGAMQPVPAIANPAGRYDLSAVSAVGAWGLFASVALAVTSLVLRYRRGDANTRQQLKWVLAGTVFLVTMFVASFPLAAVTAAAVGDIMRILGLGALPLTCGFAILRYRLFDIDRLISRTVSYAIVTALLAVPYLVLVPIVTRIVGGSSVAVAAGTLAAAAAFNPLRRRVQARVDRRFNRARYDAQRTVESFAGRLRDEVDLETLHGELLSVVRQTMQPATASLWLRAPQT